MKILGAGWKIPDNVSLEQRSKCLAQENYISYKGREVFIIHKQVFTAHPGIWTGKHWSKRKSAYLCNQAENSV